MKLGLELELGSDSQNNQIHEEKSHLSHWLTRMDLEMVLLGHCHLTQIVTNHPRAEQRRSLNESDPPVFLKENIRRYLQTHKQKNQ